MVIYCSVSYDHKLHTKANTVMSFSLSFSIIYLSLSVYLSISCTWLLELTQRRNWRQVNHSNLSVLSFLPLIIISLSLLRTLYISIYISSSLSLTWLLELYLYWQRNRRQVNHSNLSVLSYLPLIIISLSLSPIIYIYIYTYIFPSISYLAARALSLTTTKLTPRESQSSSIVSIISKTLKKKIIKDRNFS